MGVERTVNLPAGATVAWPAVVAKTGLPLKLMMIDGLPALPDEEPPEGWAELHVGTPAGMVTLRRPGGVSVIVWGNAGPELLAARDIIADALSG